MAAERLQREVKGGAAACFDEPAAPPANCPVCQAATPAPVLLPVGTTVSAPAAVHFGYDRTDISPATASELARVAQLMAAYPDARLRLTGFADLRDGKGNRHNEYLARERAAQAQRQLLAQGIAASRLTTAIGQTQGAEVANGPQRNSLVRRARAMERRVELVFDGIPGLVAENQLRDLQPDR